MSINRGHDGTHEGRLNSISDSTLDSDLLLHSMIAGGVDPPAGQANDCRKPDQAQD